MSRSGCLARSPPATAASSSTPCSPAASSATCTAVVLHGRESGATGRALRAVAWERFAGQSVQVVLAVVVLLLLDSPLSPAMPVATVLLVATALCCASAARRPPVRRGWTGRALRVVHDDLWSGLLVPRAWPGVVIASVVAVTGHVATYLLAARVVGATAPLTTLLPLAVVVLVAAGLPLNLAGWGPREGAAAWVFASAGLGAAQGVATAVAYGAMVFVASLPGAVVLATSARVVGERGAGIPASPSGAGLAGGSSRA